MYFGIFLVNDKCPGPMGKWRSKMGICMASAAANMRNLLGEGIDVMCSQKILCGDFMCNSTLDFEAEKCYLRYAFVM